MPADITGARRPQWPNIVIAIASAYALSAATWIPPEMILGSGGGGLGTAAEQWLWAAYTIGGVLGFIGLFVALKRRVIARGIVVAAGLMVLSGFLALRRPTALALLSLAVTGLALLVSAPFMGAIAPREEEGKHS